MVYDMDSISISPRVAAAWQVCCSLAVVELARRYKNLSELEIGTEQFRIMPDGTGQVFVKVRGVEVKMDISKADYAFIN